MSADSWNPQQYDKFKAERAQPFHDLVALVKPGPVMRVVDLGCGTGELTAVLHHKLQAAFTLGIDRSAAMLEKSAAFLVNGLRFQQGELQHLAEENWDLIFSNAALQWVGDHPSLFQKLASGLAPGGQLAIQMPANQGHLTHVTAAEVAEEAPFRSAMGQKPQAGILAVEEYAALLDRIGFQEQQVRLQVYGHHLASRDEVVEWVKGTLLTEYQSKLGERFPEFLRVYRERLLPKLEDRRPYFYPFKRILIWARK